MITYTTNMVKLDAFALNKEVLFVGSQKLVFVDVKIQITVPGYIFSMRVYANNEIPHTIYTSLPQLFKIDTGLSIAGTWMIDNNTNTFTYALVTLGHLP